MMRASVLFLTLLCQIHAAHLRNSSKAEAAVHAKPAAQTVPASNLKTKANDASKVVVAHSTPHANATNMKSKPQTDKEKKADKEEREAIGNLVNGLSKLPMQGGKVSAVGARMANIAHNAKKAALVSHPSTPAQKEERQKKLAQRAVDDAAQKERAQQALEKAEAAEKTVEQEKIDAHKAAEESKEALKKKAAALVAGKMAPPTKGTEKQTKAPAAKKTKDTKTAPPTKPNAKPTQALKEKEEKEGLAGLVNGLSKVPMKNGKVSQAGVRMANIAHNAKKAALVSHAASPDPVDPKEVEQAKRIQHALELADEAEKPIPEEEKAAHEEAEEARKLVGTLKKSPSAPVKGPSKYLMSKHLQ